MMPNIPRLIVTPGEPAGIGPEIIFKAIQRDWPAELIVIGDPSLWQSRYKQLKVLTKNVDELAKSAPIPHQAGSLSILPIPLATSVTPGKLDEKNAPYVTATLQLAADLCMNHQADAVVTGPVQKSILNDAGIPFKGHTEFFAEHAQVAQTVMLFVVDQIKVALATTHVPLKDVSEKITHQHLQSVLTILHSSLQTLFHIAKPRIAVAGLNPHAGEGGYLGREEINVIEPVLATLRENNFLLTN